jgi:hypothetical protein
VLPSNTQVSVAAVAGQDVSRGQFEQITSDPVEEPAAPDASGQIPHVDGTPEVVIGHIAQAMAGFATPGSPVAVAGQLGQAIIAVPQEIGQALVDCATGGDGHRVDRQLPSIGHAVCAGEVPEVAEGTATGDEHGPPPAPTHTPPLPVVAAPPLTATALDTGGAAVEAPLAELDEL